MRKILLSALPLLVLSGCTSINNTTTEISDTIPTIPQEVTWVVTNIPIPTESNVSNEATSTTNSIFDVSKIVLEWAEFSFGWYDRYKDILNINKWTIWIQMWWQDWYEVQLIYTENWKITKTSNPILWLDIWYTNKRIYQWCIEYCTANWCSKDQRTDSSVFGLEKCPLVKTISCTDDKYENAEKDCRNKTLEYLYNVMVWNITDSYISQRLQEFQDWL